MSLPRGSPTACRHLGAPGIVAAAGVGGGVGVGVAAALAAGLAAVAVPVARRATAGAVMSAPRPYLSRLRRESEPASAAPAPEKGQPAAEADWWPSSSDGGVKP